MTTLTSSLAGERLLLWRGLALGLAACAAGGLACAAQKQAGEPLLPGPEPLTTPTRFSPEPAPQASAADSRSPLAPMRGPIFDATWTAIRDKHYDPALGGLDWTAIGARYRPIALNAPDEPTFYRVVNDMLGELGHSHVFLTGPGDDDPLGEVLEEIAAPKSSNDASASSAGATGNPGIVVREIEGKAIVTRVRPGSSAERAGIRPGFVVTHIGGRALVARKPKRPLRPVEERFYVRHTAARALAGPVGTMITLRVLDNDDHPREFVLARDAPAGKPAQFGNLPTLYPEVRTDKVGDIGIVAFDLFLMGEVLDEVLAAIERFRAARMRGLILDLRGNPGGIAAMAIPVARALCEGPITLGTLQFRGFENTLTVAPSLDRKPFLGPVVILTDEGTASTAEILAAGLKDAGRAQIVGALTLGNALPSAIETLPGGAILQHVVANFRTPKGHLLEGRGVEPDRPVMESRHNFKNGQDIVLETALELLRARRAR